MSNNKPLLSGAFDIEKVKGVIEQAKKNEDPQVFVESCQISDVRYDGYLETIILYRVGFKNKRLKKTWEQLYLGRVLKPCEIKEAFPQEAIYSEILGTIFIPFPYDPCMPWLPQVYNPKAMIPIMPLIFYDQNCEVKNMTITPLAYVPQMRATLHYSMEVEETKTGNIKKVEWIAKTNISKAPERVYSNYWALWKASEGRIPMPRPMGFLLEPQLTFQEKVEGIRLGALVNAPNINQLMEDTATALAKFHNLQVPLTTTRNLEQEIRNLNRWSSVLANLKPDLKKRMELLKEDIINEMNKRFVVNAPIHADFHHTNVLVNKDKVHIIDMDEVAYGDPFVDVGRFLSSLRIPSLRMFGSFEGLRPQRELFVETYLKSNEGDEKKIHLYEAASLFTSAASTFRMQRKNWENEIPLLLEESEITFKKCLTKSVFQKSKAHTVRLSKSQFLKWAEEEEYIKVLLAPHFYNATKQQITTCKLLSKKERKGYHIFSYEIKTLKEQSTLINLFLHKTKATTYTYNHLKSFAEKIKQASDFLRFPEPLAYLPEISAFVFMDIPGISIAKVLKIGENEKIAEKLAKGLSNFYKLNQDDPLIGPEISLSSNYISPFRIKFYKGILYLHFPSRQYFKNIKKDIDSFCETLQEYGEREGEVAVVDAFITDFKRHLTI